MPSVKKILSYSIPFNVISKYRIELMGIAMLNVFIQHSLNWLQSTSDSWPVLLLGIFGRLLFTEGFLFLSGFGIYYSYHNQSQLKLFYKKRIKRLLIPFWIMTMPFFLYWLVLNEYSISVFFLRLSTIEFWIHGNYVGMWYVALSVALYAIFPILYKGIQKTIVLTLLTVLVLIAVLYFFAPDYYNQTFIGISKMPFFVLGAWAGKKSIEERSFNLTWLLFIITLLSFLYVYPVCIWLNLRESVLRISGIIVFCFIFNLLDRYNLKYNILRWFGKYTLELYILHMLLYASLSSIFPNNFMKVAIALGGSVLLCVPINKICVFISDKLVRG